MPDPLVSGWPHTLIEAMRLAAAGRDCATVGGGRGNWAATPDRVLALTRRISPSRISTVAGPGCRAGGTVAVVVGERDGGFVALLQSNGIGFGSGLSIPGLGIWLHNRGSAFSLEADHPAEYGPGRRPLHTLAPALVTRDGIPVTALASTGGDAQIQAGLQILVRLLAHRHPPAAAVGAARWAVDLPTAVPTAESFVYLEGHAPPAWSRGLDRRGHRVTTVTPLHPAFGRAQLVVDDGESLQAVSDSRSSEGGGAQR
jgi:gamma-glutamyltranspeptidase/glutathione hydrolase